MDFRTTVNWALPENRDLFQQLLTHWKSISTSGPTQEVKHIYNQYHIHGKVCGFKEADYYKLALRAYQEAFVLNPFLTILENKGIVPSNTASYSHQTFTDTLAEPFEGKRPLVICAVKDKKYYVKEIHRCFTLRDNAFIYEDCTRDTFCDGPRIFFPSLRRNHRRKMLKAIRAIEVKNHSMLNGKAMRVMWSRRDPDVRRSCKGNVFVKNLAESIDSAGLGNLFKKYGNILSSKVVMSDEGKRKGYGFVQFETEESANAAIEKLNGSTIDDKQIYVGKFVRKSDRVMPGPEARYTNLYLKNLDLDTTEALLQEKFSSFGKIVSLAVAKDNNGTSKGFGFVNFENPDDAKRALEEMNGMQFGSKVLYVARAQKKAEREQILHRQFEEKQILHQQFEEKRKEQMLKYKGSNIYVKNIDDNVSDDDLRHHFSACGTITSAIIMRDDKGISKGFGFVCFFTPQEANKAVSNFHGFMFHGKPLYVALAQRKEDRQAQLQLHYAQQITALAGTSTAIIPGEYPPYYYAATGVVSHVPPRAGLMYQPMALRPGWRANGPAPSARAFLQSPVPVVSNNTRQHRQNRGNTYSGNYVPQAQQSSQSREPSTQQRTGRAKYVPSGRQREAEKGSGFSSGGPNLGGGSQGSELLHTMLAAASPEQQKEILGEHLYALVQKLKPSLAAKITGMLLEMDNAELLVLMESPESLSTKVEEAVEVLMNSNTKVSG